VPRFDARPIGVSILAIVLFGIALQWLGLVAAVAVLVLVGAYAARNVRPLENLALAAALIAFSVGVFVWLLGLPLPLAGLISGACSVQQNSRQLAGTGAREARMETLSNLAFGLGVALSWQNLLQKLTDHPIRKEKPSFATWGNSGIAPYEGTRNQLSGNALRPSSCGLAKMESGNGALYWTGRVVEADIDLCGEPGGISRARGRSRFRA
jgi:hypothetical protein